KALAEYTETDNVQRPVGRDISEAVALTRQLVGELAELCSGYDWKAALGPGTDPKAWIKAAHAMTNHLRSPDTPGNDAEEPAQRLGNRFRTLAGQLARAWALSSGNETLADIRADVKFYEEVRKWMAKYD